MFKEQFKTLQESSKVQSAILDAITKVDEDLSYKDFAKAVAGIIKEEYGSHNVKPFLDALKKEL